MLTKVKAFKAPGSSLTFHLRESDTGRPETDLVQLLNAEGLDPVKASVSTSSYGDLDGSSITGTDVESRNIVLTLRPNPDWDTFRHANLRRILYSYFMPKKSVTLEFYSDDIDPVEISGIVEGFTDNIFSKDPEIQVSIICDDPYFTTLEPTVVTGPTGDPVTIINYGGSVEAGFLVKVTLVDGEDPPETIAIQIGEPAVTYFGVFATIDSDLYFEMSSRRLQKFVRNVNEVTHEVTNLLGKVYIQQGDTWPVFREGENKFFVVTDFGVHAWELTYFERFGGL